MVGVFVKVIRELDRHYLDWQRQEKRNVETTRPKAPASGRKVSKPARKGGRRRR